MLRKGGTTNGKAIISGMFGSVSGTGSSECVVGEQLDAALDVGGCIL